MATKNDDHATTKSFSSSGGTSRRCTIKTFSLATVSLILGTNFGIGAQSRRSLSRGESDRRREDMRRFLEQKVAEMRSHELNRFKRQLNATDKEWEVIKPRLVAVRELIHLSEGKTDQGPLVPDQGIGSASYESPVIASRATLKRLLTKVDADTETIRKQLNAVRTADEELRRKLINARGKLRSVLTVRQEAYLIVVRLLD